jgi:hypothetical protein
MGRIHLFEFTDQAWYPQIFRRMQTDYLQFVATRGSAYRVLIPLLSKGMQHAGTTEIVDLCSGGTGPWARLHEQFKQAGWSVSIKLTDKFPNPAAVQKWKNSTLPGIAYLDEPVDALKMPPELKGMRTLFEGFHHFRPEQARLILQDAAEKRAAIGIFEIILKPPFGLFLLLLAPLSTLLSYLLITPFIQPRCWSRFLWTYLLPIVPLATCWDGTISLLRVYSLSELSELTGTIPCKDYTWEMGLASTGTPVFEYSYLLGYPV